MSFSRMRTNREYAYTYYFGYAGTTILLLLESDPIASIYKFDFHISITYLRTKNELPRSMLLTIMAQNTHVNTDRRDRTHYHAAFASGIII